MSEHSSGSLKWALIALVLVGLVFGGSCFGPPGTAACGAMTGFGPAILASIEHCPAAVERLGTPVGFRLIGFGCSNYGSGQEWGEGQAWGDIPISGSKGSATADYTLSKGLGVWTPSKLVLTFGDGSKLDVAACSASYNAARSNEGMATTLRAQCDAGQARMCEGLAAWLESQGRSDEGKAARAKACKLGLATSCR